MRVNSSGSLSTIHSNALCNAGDAGHRLKLRAAVICIHDDPQLMPGAVRAGELMPRLFVQHVAVIGASLAFAFCRPASALDISVPHVVVPHFNIPRPQINVPRPQINAPPPQIFVLPRQQRMNVPLNFIVPGSLGAIKNQTTTYVPPPSSTLQGPTGMANTAVLGPPASADSCGRTPVRSCR